jgi:2-polyprenyl-6-methoxyphenol hydroxylase-like FAD-dependent oxidoreductase
MDHDVVIAGAGPVGLFLACELGLAGVRAVVLERASDPNIPTRTAGLGGRGLNIASMEAFYRRGLMDELRKSAEMWFGAPAGGSSTPAQAAAGQRFRFAGHFAGIMLNGALIDYGDPDFRDKGPAAAGCFIDLVSLEKMLERRAVDLGVPVRRGVAVTGFSQAGDGVTVETSAGDLHAGWLVGCDGGRSTVRKLAGFDFPGTPPEITAYSAVVQIADAAGLKPGWNRTPTGVYVNGPGPNRVLLVEFQGPPEDREAPVTLEELQASLRRVSGTEVTIAAMYAATRFTDNARQAASYRSGRILLAGDAAHVHSPFGGQGMNLGLGDAMNLGWKLASVIKGWADEELLDTYTAERHPIGAWALEWTRAQIAVMRPEPHARAMGEIARELIETPTGATYFAKRIAGVWQRYDLGPGHPLVGKSAPDLAFRDGTRLGAYLQLGRAVLFRFEGDSNSSAVEERERYRVVRVECEAPPPARALFVRPDGYIAWAGEEDEEGLANAFRKWLGVPDPIEIPRQNRSSPFGCARRRDRAVAKPVGSTTTAVTLSDPGLQPPAWFQHRGYSPHPPFE